MISGILFSPATPAIASMSSTSTFGFPIDSEKIAFVLSRIAARNASGFDESTRVTSMPNFGSVCVNALYVPP